MNENTIEILNRFSKSWEETIAGYKDLIDNNPGFENLTILYLYIIKLQKLGYDKYFRISKSMKVLIFSRSVDYELRYDQKFIRIEILNKSCEIILRDGGKTYREYSVKDLDDERVLNLLMSLKQTLVD